MCSVAFGIADLEDESPHVWPSLEDCVLVLRLDVHEILPAEEFQKVLEKLIATLRLIGLSN